MKMLTFLSCVSVVFADIAGDLTVTYNANKQVVITGDLTGLPADASSAGIHVHSGTDCTDKDLVGGHLLSNLVDGWAYPVPTTYSTDSDGTAKVNLRTGKYKLATADGTATIPAVQDRCIVLHGLSPQDPASRVAIGKIETDGKSFYANIAKYPGPNNLVSTPSGKLTIAAEGDELIVTGTLTGLGANLQLVGIHIHTGTDCKGGADLGSKAAVNGVVGGHLLYRGDGFSTTTYASKSDGTGTINIKTPASAYVLMKKDTTPQGATAVEDHCIVIHSQLSAREGVGKIVCDGTSCKASMGPYPKDAVPISGTLAVSTSGGMVAIKGSLVGLPRGITGAGIHVHDGTECTNNGYSDTNDILSHIGGHLKSNYVDSWAFPQPTTYSTNADGDATIDLQVSSYVIATGDAKTGIPSVEGRCIVLHGMTGDLPARAAIGKIVKDGNGYSATIEKYPGPNALGTLPSGKILVTATSAPYIQLKGDLKGLAKNLDNAGIHIHTGTDCKGGTDLKSKTAVNAVVGGHLRSQGDGFRNTVYGSNVNGEGTIDISTPSSSYALLANDGSLDVPAVENHCIVIHGEAGALRVGIGQILCTRQGSCSATMGPYPKPVSDVVVGDLTVTSAGGIVNIKGDLTGLPKSAVNAGIHVHEGTECAYKDTILGHLLSNKVDGWAYPTPTVYNTANDGSATIAVTAKSYALAKEEGTVEKPAVEDRCIVLHGISTSSLSPRAAIGKIVRNGDAYSATIGKYPGPNELKSTPSGTLTVTAHGTDSIQIAGTITGLGKKMTGAGIHVHTGTDCNGGADISDSDAVNKVVGGHLLSRGDGFSSTQYSSDRFTNGVIDISTPKNAYVLSNSEATDDGAPAVEDHCIVIHNDDNGRVSVGKIVCGESGCKASMGKYPNLDKPATAKPEPSTNKPTTIKSTTTATEEVATGTNVLMSMSALVIYCIIGL